MSFYHIIDKKKDEDEAEGEPLRTLINSGNISNLSYGAIDSDSGAGKFG